MFKDFIDQSWNKYLGSEFKKKYFQDLIIFIEKEYSSNTIFPKQNEIFSALNFTKLSEVKVVILGQDPYHGDGQAHGLAFSVQKNVKIPPSLKNIYKELESDLGIKAPIHGNLEAWARQGVLLLNNTLTVRKSLAGSHQKMGWELFTKKIIEVINTEKKNVVFILWGGPAQKKASFVDKDRHHVIESPHPSPLSSYRGFFGSKPFSQANQYFSKHNLKTIDWNID